jgi:hypothetical protein
MRGGGICASIRRAAVVATMAALTVVLAPAAAHAEPAINCTDNKPAVGFSFTCDTALVVPPGPAAYPEPEGVSFRLGLSPPDAYSTLEIISFNVPGFHCAKVFGPSADSLACSDTVMAGQTVSGTVDWKIGYHPKVPVGDCVASQLEGYTADPGPGGEYDLGIIPIPLQLCQSSNPTTPAPNQLTAARAKSAANSALLSKFGRSWRKGSSKQLICSAIGTKFSCRVSWRYHAKRHKARVVVSQSGGKVRTRLQVR